MCVFQSGSTVDFHVQLVLGKGLVQRTHLEPDSGINISEVSSYSRTPLYWPPLGNEILAFIEGWPYFRG